LNINNNNKKPSKGIFYWYCYCYRGHSDPTATPQRPHEKPEKIKNETKKPGKESQTNEMEALNVIREAIESLSAEEKIDDGKYLELMNHMKTVYGSMPQQHAPQQYAIDFIPRPVAVAPPMESMRDVVRHRYFTTGIQANQLEGFWGGEWVENANGGYTRDEFAITLDCMLKGEDDVGLINLFERYFVASEIGNCFYTFIMRDGNRVSWKDADMREKFLSLPVIRNKSIVYALLRKESVMECLLKIKDTTNQEHWAKLFYHMGFHFVNGIRYTVRNNGEAKPRSEAELKKLHLVRVSWRMNATQNMEVNLYTDKIQLGRSQIVGSMYKMALIYALLFPEFNAPVERFKYRMGGTNAYGEHRVSQYPVMAMSGITAHTRNKNRTYKQKDGDFTITYISKLNDVDA
jgi:hypothetical protein